MKVMSFNHKLNNLAVLALGLAMLGLAQGPQAQACTGKGCGGGGNTVDGVPISVYFEKRIFKAEDVLKKIKPQLDRLRAVHPDLAAALERDVKAMNWFFSDVPLEKLPFARTKIPFKTDQTMRQFDDNVVVYRPGFNKMKPEMQSVQIIQELFERHTLKNEQVNGNLMASSYWKATPIVTQNPLPSRKEIDNKLAELGYVITGNRLSMNANISINDLIVSSTNIPIQGTLTIKDLHEAHEACFAGANLMDELKDADNRKAYSDLQFNKLRLPNYMERVKSSLLGQALFSAFEVLPSDFVSSHFIPFNRQVSLRDAAIGQKAFGNVLFLHRKGVPFFSGTLHSELRSDDSGGKKLIVKFNGCRTNKEYLEIPKNSYGGFDLEQCTYNRDRDEYESLQSLPELVFSPADDDKIFLGHKRLNPNLRVKHVSVATPLSVVSNDWKLDFVDVNTNEKLNFSIDAKKFSDCLEAEVKKRVRPYSQETAPVTNQNRQDQAQ